MSSRRFDRPVIVQPGRIDRDRVIVGVSDAARILLHEWPDKESRKRIAAMQACLDVINGKKPPGAARKAFVAAAKDARIYIGELDPSDASRVGSLQSGA